eukprot:UN4654
MGTPSTNARQATPRHHNASTARAIRASLIRRRSLPMQSTRTTTREAHHHQHRNEMLRPWGRSCMKPLRLQLQWHARHYVTRDKPNYESANHQLYEQCVPHSPKRFLRMQSMKTKGV